MRISITAAVATTTVLGAVGAADAWAQPPPEPIPAQTSVLPENLADDPAPPPPPTPGSGGRANAPPAHARDMSTSAAHGEVDAGEADPPLAGWHGVFYLRDSRSRVVLFPRGRLHLDFNAFAGRGVGSVKGQEGVLAPRLFVRRLRLELAGELFRQFSFVMGADLANLSLSNANGEAQAAAGAAGQDPTSDSARFAQVQAVPSTVSLADAWINYRVCDCLNFMLGQYQAPFSMENRTSNNWHTWMERNVAIRGFVFPSSKEIGLTVWGDLGNAKIVGYQVGVFSGDGQNRPGVDGRADVMGRIWTRPLANGKGVLDKLQVGVSWHHGDRDPRYVGYAYPAITTGGGFALWRPVYTDSLGRTMRVIPSGSQDEVGGEVRVPLRRFELRGEAYYVANDTREAVDGFVLTNTERLGQMRGVAWYAQASVWPFGDPFATGEPGTAPSVTRLDLAKRPASPAGLEVFGIVAVIDATYEGGSRRDPLPDPKTPGGRGVGSDIDVVSYGLGTSYTWGRNLRTSFNWLAYETPASASTGNLAVVPGNLGERPDKAVHVLHEFGARVALMF